MVEIQASGGRLGNQMFEYALGRIIAEHFGYKLTHNLYCSELETNFNLPKILEGREISSPVQHIDGMINYESNLLETILDNNSERKIILHGFFQNYNYFKNYKDKIKKWFYIDKNYENKDDIAIHIRKNDFKHIPKFDSSDDYFLNLLRKESFNKIIIATDEPEYILIKKIMEEFNDRVIIFKGNTFETLQHFTCYNKLILSFGTYSWWMGFLSNAERIYLPNRICPGSIDLRVFDEERYVLV